MNILLFGLGYHARRIYFPVLIELQKASLVDDIIVVDLKSQKQIIEKYLLDCDAKNAHCYYLDKPLNKRLNRLVRIMLDKIVSDYKINGVIIATEPLAHMVYAKWSIRNNLCVLMDKPISTHKGVISSVKCAKKISTDYRKLSKMYEKAKKINPRIVFTVMAQRRYHGAFSRIKDSIKEVFDLTDCPVTSIQSFHSDGQWRFPAEIIEQANHPYNQGYGKCSHSGYHFFDLVSWLMEASDKKPDSLECFSSFTTPNDFIAQFDFSNYRKNFNDFDLYNKYSEKDFLRTTKKFGEIDSFNNFVFKKKSRIITLASINLCHNGFSQRNWPTSAGRDLYKGNGRVRQEMHMIEQGPFQSILYTSFQSKEVDPNQKNRLHDFGGEYHFEICISRNSTFNPEWKAVEKITSRDLFAAKMNGKSRGHQEDARRGAIMEFINDLQLDKPLKKRISDLTQHKRSVDMMSLAYQSMARRKFKMNSLVKTKL